MRTIFLRVSVLVAIATATTSVQAQAGPEERSVTIVLKERFPSTRLLGVLRRNPGAKGRDIIALKRGAATPEVLSILMATLAASVAKQGDRLSEPTTVVVYDNATLPPVRPDQRARLADAIARLKTVTPQPVPGVGNVPAITLQLTP